VTPPSDLNLAGQPGSVLRRQRLLPLAGEVRVRVGQRVQPADVVAVAAQPGAVVPVNVAHNLALMPEEVPGVLVKQVGEDVQAGEALARTKGLFGLLRTECLAPCDGKVVSVSARTGQVLIEAPPEPVHVCAFIAGEIEAVVPDYGAVVKTNGTLLQGIFGVGGECWGELVLALADPETVLTAQQIQAGMRNKVVVGGADVTADALDQAANLGITALITGGIHGRILQEFLGHDITVGITGNDDVPFTLVVTEGFGEVAMNRQTLAVLRQREGALTSVNGATQLRAGVVRPEIVVMQKVRDGEPAPQQPTAVVDRESLDDQKPADDRAQLAVGCRVRVTCAPYFGRVGRLVELPITGRELPSGSRAPVALVQLATDETVCVARANLEIVAW